MIEKLFDALYEVTNNQGKALIGTITGTVMGYVPEMKAVISETSMNLTDVYFQRCAWSVTIIIGVFAIISAIQKQVDRYNKKHKK